MLQRETQVRASEEARLLSKEQLARLGVTKLNRYALMLQCNTCQTVWSPGLEPDGLLKQGFWRCPNRCNG
ncbi:MAG TPA: hypothetical protein VN428_21180 [Bryobacteraceae bacterium]|nr:hypothetical protein [Bryobacteraceae bacterium]